MTEPIRVDVSVIPVVRNGVMVGAAANGHIVIIPPNMAEHAPWMKWDHDGMGGMVSRYRGRMVTVYAGKYGYRVTIDTLSEHATRSDVYAADDLPAAAGLLREVFR